MLTLKNVLTTLKEKKSYELNLTGLVVLTREQIGEMLSANYAQALECLEEGLILEAFEAADEPVAAEVRRLQNELERPEEVVFHLQYILNPKLQFSYKDIVYRDIVSLGNKILNDKADKEVLIDAMKSHLLTRYLVLKGFKEEDEERVKGVFFAETYLETHVDIAYLLLGYYLSGRKYYRYKRRKFLTVENLYDYIMAKQSFSNFSKGMGENYLFQAWLFYIGYKDAVEKWQHLVVELDAPVQY